MHADIPDYLLPQLKKTARRLNMPVSELVVDAVVAYMQDLEDIEASKKKLRYSSRSSVHHDMQERPAH